MTSSFRKHSTHSSTHLEFTLKHKAQPHSKSSIEDSPGAMKKIKVKIGSIQLKNGIVTITTSYAKGKFRKRC